MTLTLAIALAVILPTALWLAHRRDESHAERWARERHLELTPDSLELIERYLRRARILRTWGAAAGAVLPSLLELAINGRVEVLGFGSDGESAPLAFGWIFTGYLVGALTAEITLARPRPGQRRTASLVRRELGDYLPRPVLLGQRAATVSAALGLIAMGLVPYADDVSIPGAAGLAVGAVIVVAFGAGLEAIERWLVVRPQPFTDPAMVAADDAIRVHSIDALAGAGLAVLLLVCCGIALGIQASESDVLGTVMIVPAAGCLIASLAVCRGVGTEARRVRADTRGPAPA